MIFAIAVVILLIYIVEELKKYYGVGLPCRTLLHCLRLAA